MTATLTAPTRTQRLRFTDLVAAEWIKIAASRQAASDWTNMPIQLTENSVDHRAGETR